MKYKALIYYLFFRDYSYVVPIGIFTGHMGLSLGTWDFSRRAKWKTHMWYLRKSEWNLLISNFVSWHCSQKVRSHSTSPWWCFIQISEWSDNLHSGSAHPKGERREKRRMWLRKSKEHIWECNSPTGIMWLFLNQLLWLRKMQLRFSSIWFHVYLWSQRWAGVCSHTKYVDL